MFKFLKCFIAYSSVLLVVSCSTSQGSIIYRDVFVPTPCEIDLPLRPVTQDDIILDNLAVIEYALKLEYLFDACRK